MTQSQQPKEKSPRDMSLKEAVENFAEKVEVLFPTPSWEKEFDERFNEVYFAELKSEAYYGDINTKTLKAFIQKAVDQARQEGYEESKEIAVRLYKTYGKINPDIFCTVIDQKISDLPEALTSEKE